MLLTDSSTGPRVLLTRRTPDLADYPEQLVFPGGAGDDGDQGPVSTALREAHEEVGLDPDSVQIIGLLAPYALTDSGFLVTPVLAWSDQPGFPDPVNPAEVSAIVDVPLDNRGGASPPAGTADAATGRGTVDAPGYGPMTAAVLDLLARMLGSDRATDRPAR